MDSWHVAVIASEPLTRHNASSRKLAQAVPSGGWLGLPHDLPHMIVIATSPGGNVR
jgi:hypothetical protein